MFKKGSKLYSILYNKCPKCHEGNFMAEKNIFKLNKAFKMHDTCSNCGLKYTIEPSFFYGAMYVNYALTVGVGVITFAICSLFFNLNFIQTFIPIIGMLILTAPITIRLSRIIWINIFVHFDPSSKKINKTE
jgi:ribosomal protein S27AE